MANSIPSDKRPVPWRCRIFGHKWKPCHRKDQTKEFGLPVWVYVDDVCQRCYRTEWRMPS